MKKAVFSALLVGAMCLTTAGAGWAASAGVINQQTQESLADFRQEVPGANELLSKAKGVLVFPKVIKAAVGVGGEYGEGALMVDGKTVDYYNLVSASYGFQLGGQKKTIIFVFMEDSALQRFRASEGWQAGVDASVALVKIGAHGAINTAEYKKPVLAFVIDQKGLMYDLSLKGTKITRVKK